MSLIKWTVSIGLEGCTREGTVEVRDDATEQEIEDIVREEVLNEVEWTWFKDEAAKEELESDD